MTGREGPPCFGEAPFFLSGFPSGGVVVCLPWCGGLAPEPPVVKDPFLTPTDMKDPFLTPTDMKDPFLTLDVRKGSFMCGAVTSGVVPS